MSWARCWEVWVGLGLIVGSPWMPPETHYFTLGDAGLWFGGIVLGVGLLRDLRELRTTRPRDGPKEVAMCAESIVGVVAIAVGLALVAATGLNLLNPTWLARSITWGTLAVAAGASVIFAAWVHDLVIVKRGGRYRLDRDPDHGSFVVHFFRGQAKECLLPMDD